MLALRIKPLLLVVFLCGAGLGVGPATGQLPEGATEGNDVSGGGGNEPVKNPLPDEFIDHTRPKDPSQRGVGDTVPVHKDRVVRMLIGGLKGDAGDSLEDCDRKAAIKELEEFATKALGSREQAQRFVRAMALKLNATCDEIKQVASNLKKTEDPAQANRLRRAVEDVAVLGGTTPVSNNPNINRFVEFSVFRGIPQVNGGSLPVFGGGGFNPFLAAGNNQGFGGGFEGRAFPVGASARNPFYSMPLSSPALDADLDRLLYLATPSLGISRAFTLVKLLHDVQAVRSEVFSIQEQFLNKTLTETDATKILTDYEEKFTKSSSSPAGDSLTSILPTTILHNTAELAGLNATESKRFARAISQTIGPTLNSTQALTIHHAVRDLDSNQLTELTDEMEKIGKGTTTPDEATGHDWIFSPNNSIGGGKRAILTPLESSTRMFSSERACGFSIETDRGIVYPWVATLSCNRIQCTGSLISSSLILTSASCILSCGNDAVRVTLGDARIMKVLEVQAESAVVQPGFSSSRDPQLDIGLVKLFTPIDFNLNPLIYPICLVGVETDDPSIECEVVLSGQRQPIQQNPFQKSVVSCFQPGNQNCLSNGLLQKAACVRLNNCISISAQSSVPVICHRMNQIPARYYQWGVTTSDHHSPGGGGVCYNGVARISDSISFLSSGVALPSITT